MKFTAQQIAVKLHGEIEGNPKAEIFELAKIENAKKGSLTFLSNPKYTPYIYKTKASAIIVNKNLVLEDNLKSTLIRVNNPYESFSTLLDYYKKVTVERTGVSSSAEIHESVKIESNCYIGSMTLIEKGSEVSKNVKIFPHVYIGPNVTIGEGSVIFAGAKIMEDTVIGKNCVIHSGAVIGSDGFGFAPQENGAYKKIPHTGRVILGENVDVGANSTIDKATLGDTLIGNGVKLDNQIQIAHNVEIGSNTVIAGQTGIAGSAKIGKNCVIGGQVGIVGHITIGDNVKVQGQSGIISNVENNAVVQGTPAFSYNSYSKSYVHFKNLPEIIKKFDSIEKKNKK
ncbi:MAG: UDP-3-O-(3-hydroxymyristoyl)glucosamine N-acyltransferase [Flavobacteriaceae bacterium]|nr:UDP-3-O-(3-hydroxymyristoyl)glucosamine N-acyltransferase [Flavobacteriaceae bacterium]|tara:strand:- start:4330 stop:5352 length:1023 start_codon:yes stop_codon:yes gene_type:complete